MPPHRSDPELLVLHTLRLKGFVDADVVANACRQPEPSPSTNRSTSCATVGTSSRRDGRISGWSLTPQGGPRASGCSPPSSTPSVAGRWSWTPIVGSSSSTSRSSSAARAGSCVTARRCCAPTSTRRSYDNEILAELDRLDDAVQPICSDLAAVLERFAYYNGRFAVARLRVHDGEHDWFTKPMIDSYHAVWFELHENLLATLNIDARSRTASRPSTGGRYGAIRTSTDGDDHAVRRRRRGSISTARPSSRRWLVEQGNEGLVIAGTTGESPTLTHEEQIELVRTVCQSVSVPVLAGAGSNDTRAAIELTERATEAGAAAILSVTPYYNRPSQAGLIAALPCRSPRRPICRSCSTTSRCAPAARSTPRRSSSSRTTCPTSSR